MNAQLLLGYVRSDATVFGEHYGENAFGIMPGGGVDIGSGKVAARVEFGVGQVFYELATETDIRFVMGIVIRSGERQ